MLTKNDLKLLSALEEDGRLSYAELSRKLDMSIPTVTRRVNTLFKNKTFTISAVPNPYKLGYRAQAVIAMNVPFDKVNRVSDRLRDNYYINLVVTTFGRFNLMAAVYYTTWEKLHDFITAGLKAGGDFCEVEAFFVRDTVKRFYGFTPENGGGYTEPGIDEADQQIIEELSRNGRVSNLQLAKTLGVSVSAVSRRISRIINDDLVQIRAIVDPNKLGYGVNAYVLIKAERDQVENICRKLSLYEEVISIMTLVNGYDIFVSLVSRRPEGLYEFIQEMIGPLEGITSIETLVRGEIIKRYYGNFRSSDLTPHTAVAGF